MVKLIYCFSTTLITVNIVAAEFVSQPAEKNVLLGTTHAEFQCSATGGSPHWLIDGVELDLYPGSPHDRRGITRSFWEQRGSIFTIGLRVSGSEATNNNTEVQCVVRDVQSEPVFFRIQGSHLANELVHLLKFKWTGLLTSPPDLTVSALNFSTVHLTWSPSPTLNVTGNVQSSVLGYSILVRNESGDIVMAVNSTMEEYHYTIAEENECVLAAYHIHVAGINGIGIGQYSQPMTFTLGSKSI